MASLLPIPITWWTLLDLAVLAAGIWLFVRLVRGTRAAQMLAGLATVAVLVAVLRRLPIPFTGTSRSLFPMPTPTPMNAPRKI